MDEENNIKLAIEVKERELTLTDVKNSILKARKESINELLFNAPGINEKEKQEIYEEFSKTWASGTNIYQVSIQELMKVGLSLTGEEGRKVFLTNIGEQLDQYNTQPTNRQRWKELLESL
jgi:L-lactate utilization protein LutC